MIVTGPSRSRHRRRLRSNLAFQRDQNTRSLRYLRPIPALIFRSEFPAAVLQNGLNSRRFFVMSFSRQSKFLLLLCAAIFHCGTPEGLAAGAPLAPRSEQADALTAGAAGSLAAEVAAISGAAGSSRTKKEKLISAAVRGAVLATTAELKGSSSILKAALALTAAAAEAAPPYADVIARAAAFAGPVAGIDSAQAKIRAAAFAAAKEAGPGQSSFRSPEVSSSRSGLSPELAAGGATVRYTRTRSGDSEPQDSGPSAPNEPGSGRINLGKNSSLALTAAVNVSHDSNLYLQPDQGVLTTAGTVSAGPTSETIMSLRPGVEFTFGQKSLAHGSLAYGMAFTRYDKSEASSKLSNASADFGYSGGRTQLGAKLTFAQSEQATRDLASVSGQNLLRRDTGSYSTSAETSVWTKTSVEVGANGGWTRYKQAGVIGDKNLTLPLKVYVDITPKLAVSAGFSYDQTTPQGDGPKGRGNFYNVGLRGSITEKLSSNFSIGYRNRSVGDAPSESSLGFDGSFGLQITAKTSLNLALARNFSTSPSGESLKNTNVSLYLSSAPTLNWQFAGGLSYRDVDYGPRVFVVRPVLTPNDRADKFLQLNLSATYLFTSWMNATVSWAASQNRSNLADSEFEGSILSAMLGFRY